MRGRGLLSGHARGCACPGAGRGCLRLRSGPDPSLADLVGERASDCALRWAPRPGSVAAAEASL